MKRREILKYTALVTGAAVSAPLWSSLLSGCQPEMNADSAEGLRFFSREEFALVKDLIDLILPKTDSPSASEVGVDHTIDVMVGTVYPEADRTAYKKGFEALVIYLNRAAGEKGWAKLPADQKWPLLQQLAGTKEANASDAQKALLDLKQQTVAYYLSTEAIATNYLNYLPIPGVYDACIKLEEVGGKAWAE